MSSVTRLDSMVIDGAGGLRLGGVYGTAITFGGSGARLRPVPRTPADFREVDLDAATGNQRWATSCPPPPTSSVGVDGSGNSVIAGSFQNTVDFGSTARLTSVGGYDIALAKLDPTGHLLWSKSFGGAGDDTAGAITVDSAGDIVLDALPGATINFGGGPLSGGSPALVKLDSAGNYLWGKSFGGTAIIESLVADGTNIVAAGLAEGNITLRGAGWRRRGRQHPHRSDGDELDASNGRLVGPPLRQWRRRASRSHGRGQHAAPGYAVAETSGSGSLNFGARRCLLHGDVRAGARSGALSSAAIDARRPGDARETPASPGKTIAVPIREPRRRLPGRRRLVCAGSGRGNSRLGSTCSLHHQESDAALRSLRSRVRRRLPFRCARVRIHFEAVGTLFRTSRSWARTPIFDLDLESLVGASRRSSSSPGLRTW